MMLSFCNEEIQIYRLRVSDHNDVTFINFSYFKIIEDNRKGGINE